MHEPHELTRPLPTRRRRLIAVIAILGASGVCIGSTVVAALALHRDPAPAAAAITLPQSICASVSLIVPPPPVVAPIVESEDTDYEEPMAPAPRATSPTIDAGCIFNSIDDVACEWDDGFPAISADGTLIATKYIPDDNNRGNPGLIIRFVDTRSSRVVRDLVVLSPDEVETEAEAQSPKLLAKITRRAADAQRTIDAGHYRPLVLLVDSDGSAYDDEGGGSDEPTVSGTLQTELVGTAVRVVDTTSSKVVIQARFPIAAVFPKRLTDTDDCYPTSTREVDVWWDEVTRNLYAEAIYASPPCYCASQIRNYVRHAQ